MSDPAWTACVTNQHLVTLLHVVRVRVIVRCLANTVPSTSQKVCPTQHLPIMDDDVKIVDLARARSKLDGTVLLSAILAAVVIPIVHKILHNAVFTVRALSNMKYVVLGAIGVLSYIASVILQLFSASCGVGVTCVTSHSACSLWVSDC